MTERIFLDTNVLVYAFDSAEPAKRARALAILDRSATEYREATPVVSTQVVQEFYVTVVQKLDQPLSEEMAAEAVERLVRLPVVQVDTRVILAAIRLSRGHRLSLWDALIVRAAIDGGCHRLLSEDLHHGQQFEQLVIENPFLSL